MHACMSSHMCMHCTCMYLHLKAAMEAGWLLQSVPWRAGDGTMVEAAAAAALYTKCVVAAEA